MTATLDDFEEIEAELDAIHVREYFFGYVDMEKAEATVKSLYDLDCRFPNATIEFVINSVGGDLPAGDAVYSELAALSTRGGGTHHVITKVRGEAGSIASLIFQAGDERIGGKVDYLLLHEPMFTVEDLFVSQVRAKVQECEKWLEKYIDVHMERCNRPRSWLEHNIVGGLDWVVMMDEAIEYGLADQLG